MPYAVDVFSSASVIICSSLSDPAIRSIYSANLRLLNCMPPIDIYIVY